jgi:ribosomal protein L37AE/L43A
MTQKTKEEEDTKKIRCSKCNSTLGYLRIKDKIWVCRSCGHETKDVVI